MILEGHFEGPGGVEIHITARSRDAEANSSMSANAAPLRRFLREEATKLQRRFVVMECVLLAGEPTDTPEATVPPPKTLAHAEHLVALLRGAATPGSSPWLVLSEVMDDLEAVRNLPESKPV